MLVNTLKSILAYIRVQHRDELSRKRFAAIPVGTRLRTIPISVGFGSNISVQAVKLVSGPSHFGYFFDHRSGVLIHGHACYTTAYRNVTSH